MESVEARMNHLEKSMRRWRIGAVVFGTSVVLAHSLGLAQPKADEVKADSISGLVITADVLRVRRLAMIGPGVHIDGEGLSVVPDEGGGRASSVRVHAGGVQIASREAAPNDGREVIFSTLVHSLGIRSAMRAERLPDAGFGYGPYGAELLGAEQSALLLDAGAGLADDAPQLRDWLSELNAEESGPSDE